MRYLKDYHPQPYHFADFAITNSDIARDKKRRRSPVMSFCVTEVKSMAANQDHQDP